MPDCTLSVPNWIQLLHSLTRIVCEYAKDEWISKYLNAPSRNHSPSPTVVSSNDGASFDPPSPTLFTQSSVHFTTSLSLRDNKPEERSGYSSLHLLPDKVSTHHRKASSATFTSSHEGYSSLDETEPDHGSAEDGMVALQPVRSDPIRIVASPTHTRRYHIRPLNALPCQIRHRIS
jgi:hypothetical protein